MYRILVVDYEEMIRSLIRKYAEFEGNQVTEAENGMEAVELCRRHPEAFDIIIMDVMMPVMNGYEAAREIRRLPVRDAAGVKIVALTANAFAEDIKTSLDAGMDAHVAKPVDIDSLARVLGTVCR